MINDIYYKFLIFFLKLKSRKSSRKSTLETVQEKPDLKRKHETESMEIEENGLDHSQDEQNSHEENEETLEDDEDDDVDIEDDQEEQIDSDENFEPENKRRRVSAQSKGKKTPSKSKTEHNNSDTKTKRNKTKQKVDAKSNHKETTKTTTTTTVTTIKSEVIKTEPETVVPKLPPIRQLVYDLVLNLAQRISAESTTKSVVRNGGAFDIKTKLKTKTKKLNTGPNIVESLIEMAPEVITDLNRNNDMARASSLPPSNRDRISELCDFLCNFYEEKLSK